MLFYRTKVYDRIPNLFPYHFSILFFVSPARSPPTMPHSKHPKCPYFTPSRYNPQPMQPMHRDPSPSPPSPSLPHLLNQLASLSQHPDQSQQLQCQLQQSYLGESMSMLDLDPMHAVDTTAQGLGQYCRKQVQSTWLGGEEQLREMNCRLLEDNRILMRECVRLRRISVGGTTRSTEAQGCMEFMCLEYLNEINRLKAENLQLRVTTAKHASCLKDIDIVQCLSQIKANHQKMTQKIQQLKQQDRKGRLSQSNTTTTITTKNEPREPKEPHRNILNVQAVYYEQPKQPEISSHRQDINRLARVGSGHLVTTKSKPILK